jgi:hypothetical protein
MKYVKMLGLLAVAAAALMAFVGTASATTVTSSAGTTPTIKAESTNSELHGAFITVKCEESIVEGGVDSHGAAVTVEGAVDVLTFDKCNYKVTVENKGSIIAHPDPAEKAKTGDAIITSANAVIAIHTSVGECIFTTKSTGTQIGTMTGGSGAVMNMNSAAIPRTGGSFFCGSSGTWTGSYKVVSPSSIEIH